MDYRSLVPKDAAFNTMNYTYDAEGKLTQPAEGNDYDTFSYSFGAQLTQIQKVRGGGVQQTLSYGYDGMGQRVKVTDSQGTRYFLYDGGMRVLEPMPIPCWVGAVQIPPHQRAGQYYTVFI